MSVDVISRSIPAFPCLVVWGALGCYLFVPALELCDDLVDPGYMRVSFMRVSSLQVFLTNTVWLKGKLVYVSLSSY